MKASHPTVIKFNGSLKDLSSLIHSHDGLTVLDIDASWCPCCRRISKMLPIFAKEYPDVQIIRVDGDINPEIKTYFGVDHLPSLKFIKSKKHLDPIDTIVGVNIPLIKEKLHLLR